MRQETKLYAYLRHQTKTKRGLQLLMHTELHDNIYVNGMEIYNNRRDYNIVLL